GEGAVVLQHLIRPPSLTLPRSTGRGNFRLGTCTLCKKLDVSKDPHMTSRLLLSVLVLICAIVGCAADPQPASDPAKEQTKQAAAPAATHPVGVAGGAELLQQRSNFAGYGTESYRLVSEKNE